MDEVSDRGFSGSSGDTNQFQVADWVSVIVREELSTGALSFFFKRRFRGVLQRDSIARNVDKKRILSLDVRLTRRP